MRFSYKEKESGILGKVLRPLIKIKIFSQLKNEWEVIDDVLADTGADKEFETKIAIADSNDVPPILGRYTALDLFNLEFRKGKEIIFNN